MRRCLLPAVLLLLTAACGGGSPDGAEMPGPSRPTASVDPLFDRGRAVIETGSAEVIVDVEIARSDEAHQKGLMHRTELAEGAGMVFLFEDEAPRGFWMKDTLIPLSIAFFDAEGTIVAVFDMAPCEGDPCPVYESGAPAQGALEVNAGFFSERGVDEGDTITLRE